MKALETLIFGERVEGEKLPEEPQERIVQVIEKPQFHEWCRLFNISSRAHQNPIFYEN
jgi:hypothetical protein